MIAVAVEDSVAGGTHAARPARRSESGGGAIIRPPDTPRVEQHAGEITCVVGVEVGENGLHM